MLFCFSGRGYLEETGAKTEHFREKGDKGLQLYSMRKLLHFFEH